MSFPPHSFFFLFLFVLLLKYAYPTSQGQQHSRGISGHSHTAVTLDVRISDTAALFGRLMGTEWPEASVPVRGKDKPLFVSFGSWWSVPTFLNTILGSWHITSSLKVRQIHTELPRTVADRQDVHVRHSSFDVRRWWGKHQRLCLHAITIKRCLKRVTCSDLIDVQARTSADCQRMTGRS